MQAQGLGGMSRMVSGNARAPGKTGMTFDHIFSRLQGKLQKSCETVAEFHNLTGVMNDIQDALGKSLVSLTFRSLTYCLNSCRPLPIYPLFDLPPPKTPPNQPSNAYRPLHPLKQSSKPSSTIPNPSLRAMSTKYEHSRALLPSTTLSNMRSVPSGAC